MNVTRQWYESYKARRKSSGAKSERTVPDGTVAARKGKEENPTRHVVGVRSFRTRLCDPDNLCPKYFIDALRYAGAIPDDRPQDIELHISQTKVSSKSQERTEIEVVER